MAGVKAILVACVCDGEGLANGKHSIIETELGQNTSTIWLDCERRFFAGKRKSVRLLSGLRVARERVTRTKRFTGFENSLIEMMCRNRNRQTGAIPIGKAENPLKVTAELTLLQKYTA